MAARVCKVLMAEHPDSQWTLATSPGSYTLRPKHCGLLGRACYWTYSRSVRSGGTKQKHACTYIYIYTYYIYIYMCLYVCVYVYMSPNLQQNSPPPPPLNPKPETPLLQVCSWGILRSPCPRSQIPRTRTLTGAPSAKRGLRMLLIVPQGGFRAQGFLGFLGFSGKSGFRVCPTQQTHSSLCSIQIGAPTRI